MANKGRATRLESPSGRSAASSDAFEPNIEACVQLSHKPRRPLSPARSQADPRLPRNSQMLALLGQNEERKAAKLDKKRDALLKKAEKLKSAYEDECKEAVRAEEARLCVGFPSPTAREEENASRSPSRLSARYWR